jgi:hypothetical protein
MVRLKCEAQRVEVSGNSLKSILDERERELSMKREKRENFMTMCAFVCLSITHCFVPEYKDKWKWIFEIKILFRFDLTMFCVLFCYLVFFLLLNVLRKIHTVFWFALFNDFAFSLTLSLTLVHL